METWIQWITKAPSRTLQGPHPNDCNAHAPGRQRGYFHRVWQTNRSMARCCPPKGDLAQALPSRLRCCVACQAAVRKAQDRGHSRDRPHYLYITVQRPHQPAAQQKRKPGGQCLKACLPGLTADTTVFAIVRNAEGKVRKAGRQGIASRGCLESGICCTWALNAPGGRLRFVWRCLNSTGAFTLPNSLRQLKSDSQWQRKARLNLTCGYRPRHGFPQRKTASNTQKL